MKIRHLDDVSLVVRPVQVLGDPVEGHALGRVEVVKDLLPVGAVALQAVQGASGRVQPEDGAAARVRLDRGGAALAPDRVEEEALHRLVDVHAWGEKV